MGMLLKVFLRYLVFSEQSETVVEPNIEVEIRLEESNRDKFLLLGNIESDFETSLLSSLDDMNMKFDTSQKSREEEFNDEIRIQRGIDDSKVKIETSKEHLYCCKCKIKNNSQLISIPEVTKITTSTQTEEEGIFQKVESFQEQEQAECEKENSLKDEVKGSELVNNEKNNRQNEILPENYCFGCYDKLIWENPVIEDEQLYRLMFFYSIDEKEIFE